MIKPASTWFVFSRVRGAFDSRCAERRFVLAAGLHVVGVEHGGRLSAH